MERRKCARGNEVNVASAVNSFGQVGLEDFLDEKSHTTTAKPFDLSKKPDILKATSSLLDEAESEDIESVDGSIRASTVRVRSFFSSAVTFPL